jgi:hypothetical protein
LVAAFFGAAFLVAFFTAAFLAGAFFAVVFLATAFLPVLFDAGAAFFTGADPADDFLVAAFFFVAIFFKFSLQTKNYLCVLICRKNRLQYS